MLTPMKTSLDHLDDERKRDELKIIVRMIREKFDVEMIILFGSYARGDAVEELGSDGVHYIYQSDFDLLVIVDDKKLAKKWRVWDKMVADIDRNVAVRTPVSIITDNIDHVNHNLRHGQYFYSDIKKEGVLLYNSERHELAEPRKISLEERKEKAEEDYKYWYTKANDFFDQYGYALNYKKYEKCPSINYKMSSASWRIHFDWSPDII